MNSVPTIRTRALNTKPLRNDGEYVLYWMTSARRLHWNFALDQAVDRCTALGKPLVILEAISLFPRWTSARFHRFVMDGMAEKAEASIPPGVRYYPYVEPTLDDGRGLVDALAARACVVVCDDFPCHFLPRMHEVVSGRAKVRFESIDGNGLLPMAVADRTFGAAYHFRRFLQKTLPDHLLDGPGADALERMPAMAAPILPPDVVERWGPTPLSELRDDSLLSALPLDHSVQPTGSAGGEEAAGAIVESFVRYRLPGYKEHRNHPDRGTSSGLSPYLHWGHVSAHEVFHRIAAHEGWSLVRLGSETNGKREGWWGMSPEAEAFLDQLVTWRELGFNMSSREPGYDRFDSLPGWSQRTLAAHAEDPRPWVYDLDAFDAAATHDPIWNAAQRQLRETGVIHNYLRMLWGKKILEWSADPRAALEVMIELNNSYALDGRDPNSYSGIFWILGRYDRGWPRRPVFGVVRSMSSESTRRKVKLAEYLERYG